MTVRRRHRLALAPPCALRAGALAIALLLPTPAAAQEATADSVFVEASRLFARGEIKAACERFGTSYKLDPAPGTLFNMAVCHERDGRSWKARGEFLDFIDRAFKVGKGDKAQPAIEHVRAIDVRLPRVQLVFPSNGNVDSISVDGAPLAAQDWNNPVPVDPDRAQHDLEFRGVSLTSAKRTVAAASGGAILRVDVPVLAPAAPPQPLRAPLVAPTPGPPTPAAASHPTATVGIVVGGAGVAVLVTGGIFGGLTFSERNAAQSVCPGSAHVCPPANVSAAQSHHASAETDSSVSTVGLGVGIVAVGVGAYLVFRHPRSEPSAGVHLAPMVGRDGGGLVLAGPF